MSDQSDSLDVARLQLDAVKTAADAEAQLLGARAAWNTAMMDLIGKRVQVEKDIALVRAMEAALVAYRRANAELETRRRQLERRAATISDAVKHAGWVERGEDLDPDNVRFVWIGFRCLLNHVSLGTEAVTLPAVPAEALTAGNFAHPRDPDDPCGRAPESCADPRRLIEWLADLSYMPRVGSPAVRALRDVGAALASHARQRLHALREELAGLNHELLALRQQSWQTVNFAAPPRTGAET